MACVDGHLRHSAAQDCTISLVQALCPKPFAVRVIQKILWQEPLYCCLASSSFWRELPVLYVYHQAR